MARTGFRASCLLWRRNLGGESDRSHPVYEFGLAFHFQSMGRDPLTAGMSRLESLRFPFDTSVPEGSVGFSGTNRRKQSTYAFLFGTIVPKVMFLGE